MLSRRSIFLCFLLAAPMALGLELADIPEKWRLPIVRLADPDPAARKLAADGLLAAGGNAVGALAIAARDNSSEVGAAARDILRDIAIGITARTPEKLVEIARQYRHGRRMRDDQAVEAAVKAFCQNSPDGYVLLAGLVQLDKAGNGFAHFMPTPVLSDAAQAAPSVAVRLVQAGRELDVCRVLHLASLIEESPARGDADFVTFLALASEDNKELPAAWAALRRVVGDAALVQPADPNAVAIAWTGRQSLAPPAVRWPARPVDELRQYGQSAADLRSLAFMCEWPALASRLPPRGVSSASTQAMALTSLAHRLAATGRGGEIVEAIKQAVSSGGADAPSAAQALLLAGRADEADRLLSGAAGHPEWLSQLGRYSAVLDALAGAEPNESVQRQLLRIEAELHLGVPVDETLARLAATLVVRKDLFEMKAAVEVLQRGGRRNQAIELAAATVDQAQQWDEQSLFQSLYGQRSYDAAKLYRWLELEKGGSLKASLVRIDRILSAGLSPAEVDAMVEKLRKDTDDLAIVNTLVPTICRVVRLHGQPARARDMLLRASKGRFSLNGIKAGAGEELMRLGEYAEAAKLLEQSATADPEPLLRYLWGISVERAGEARSGRAICRVASLLPLGNARQRLDQAIALFDEGYSEHARRELALCLRMRNFAPAEAAEALPYLAELRYHQGEPEEAADAMAQSLVSRFLGGESPARPIGRDLHRFLRCRIRAAVARGDNAGAFAELDEATRSFPDDSIILCDSLAVMLAKPGFSAQASARAGEWIARRRKLLEQYPNSAELMAGLALVLLRQGGDAGGAAALLDKAAGIDADNREARLVRAESRFVLGDRAGAVQIVRTMAQRDPLDRSLLLAIVRFERGKTDDPWPEF